MRTVGAKSGVPVQWLRVRPMRDCSRFRQDLWRACGVDPARQRSVREVPFTRLRLADFTGSVPWRRFRSVRGQAHYSGSYASATTGGHVLHGSRLLLADFDARVCGIYAQGGDSGGRNGVTGNDGA
jgi:hypothetical protein